VPTLARRWRALASVALLPLLFLALPAAAQPIGVDDGPVACDPADPDPGETTTCTAEGLQPSSPFTWEASFADGTTRTGDGTADADGVGEFEVAVPDGEEAEGDYTVTVNGTDADGEPYEERHEGTVGGGGLSPLGLPSEPGEEPTEGGDAPGEEGEEDDAEEPAPAGDDEAFGAPGDDEGQVDPVPEGAVAAGMGGTATDPTPLRALAAVLLAVAVTGHVLLRRATGTATADR
jgi:hypothetical protein